MKAGLHVLADKPWILKSSDLPQLESTLAECLTLVPATGTLQPDDEQVITVRARCGREISLPTSNEYLKLVISEGATGQIVQSVGVTLTLFSVFSSFSVLPALGINFGPVELDDHCRQTQLPSPLSRSRTARAALQRHLHCCLSMLIA